MGMGWLEEDPEDKDEAPLGKDGVSFLGGFSVSDRLGAPGGGIAAGTAFPAFASTDALVEGMVIPPRVDTLAGTRLGRVLEVW